MAGAAALPRLLALAIERDAILEEYVEKSDTFARTLVSSGTFGFLPGVPSAYTQPLYAWFLAALYWPLERSWVVVGLAQVVVAVATALLVLAIGSHLVDGQDRRDRRARRDAAPVPRLARRPREPRDPRRAPRAPPSCCSRSSRTSAARSCCAIATGRVAGLAILSNARLLLLPLVLAPYVAWRVRPGRRAVAAALLVVVGAAAVTAPWVVRNRVVIGCATITTDTRALWKANNPATYDVLAGGGWIDDVPDLPGVPPWPEKAAAISVAAAKAVDECAQASFYRDEVIDFWRDQPGEKARLAVAGGRDALVAVPQRRRRRPRPAGRSSDLVQRTVEPAFVLAALRARALGRLPRAAPLRRARGARCSASTR